MAGPGSETGRERPPEGRDSHGERHPNGWRIRPGADGRGAPPPSQPPRPRVFGPGFLIFFLVLLLLNIVLTSTLTTTPTRVRIPYSPTFLAQINAGNVTSISSKGTTVQGNFRTAVRYPANSTAAPVTKFVTELPEFANDNALMSLLRSKGVVINATPPSTGTSVFVTLLLSFGPALLIVLLFVWMMRRAAGGITGGVGAFGRSRARRIGGVRRRARRARADAQPDPHRDGRVRPFGRGDRDLPPPTAPRCSTLRCCARPL